MPKITNNTRETLDFIVAGKPKDGVPPTKSLGPGETADIDVDINNTTFRGRLLAGAISVPSSLAGKVEASVSAQDKPSR